MGDSPACDSRPVNLVADQNEARGYRDLIEQHGSPLLVYNPQVLVDHYKALEQALPGVDLYYAVKAHPHEAIISTIDELGGGFDVASAGEGRSICYCAMDVFSSCQSGQLMRSSVDNLLR